MKTQNFLRNVAIAAIGLSAAACEVKDPVQGVEVRIAYTATKTAGLVAAIDAATSIPIQTPVEFEFTGAAASRIVDGVAEPFTKGTTENGYLIFGVKGVRPTAAAPVELQVIARAAGYVDASQTITLTDSLNGPFKLAMVKIGAAPAGTSATRVSSGATNATGQVTQALTVSTSAEARTQGTVSATLPAGTVVRDAAGNPLSGALTALAVYNNGIDAAAQAAFPGGDFIGKVQDGASTTTRLIQPVVTATIAVQDATGREAKTFTGGAMQISLDIPKDAINYAAGRTVAQGDVLPLWSHDDATGVFKREGDVTLGAPDARGNFRVTFPATHLSSNVIGNSVAACQAQDYVHITGNPNSIPIAYQWSWDNKRGLTTIHSTQRIPFFRIPGRSYTLTATLPTSGVKVGEATYPNLCDNAPKALTVTISTTAAIDLDVAVECSNKVVLYPSLPVFGQGAQGQQILGWLKDGKGRVDGLVPNAATTLSGMYYAGGKMRFGSASVTAPAAGQVGTATMRFSISGSC